MDHMDNNIPWSFKFPHQPKNTQKQIYTPTKVRPQIPIGIEFVVSQVGPKNHENTRSYYSPKTNGLTTDGFSLGWQQKRPLDHRIDDFWRGGWKSSGSWWDCEPHVHTTGMARNSHVHSFQWMFAWTIMPHLKQVVVTNLGYSCCPLTWDDPPVVAGEYPMDIRKGSRCLIWMGPSSPPNKNIYFAIRNDYQSHKSYTISLILLQIAWMFQKLGFVSVWQVILWRLGDIYPVTLPWKSTRMSPEKVRFSTRTWIIFQASIFPGTNCWFSGSVAV